MCRWTLLCKLVLSDGNRTRSDKFSIGAEFVVGQEGREPKPRPQTAPPKANPDNFIGLLRKDVRSQTKQVIAENMGLRDAEAEKFWPVCDQYATELSSIYDTTIALLNDYAETQQRDGASKPELHRQARLG